jgi:hypothetical protein
MRNSIARGQLGRCRNGQTINTYNQSGRDTPDTPCTSCIMCAKSRAPRWIVTCVLRCAYTKPGNNSNTVSRSFFFFFFIILFFYFIYLFFFFHPTNTFTLVGGNRRRRRCRNRLSRNSWTETDDCAALMPAGVTRVWRIERAAELTRSPR